MGAFKFKNCIMEMVGTFALCYVGGLSIFGSLTLSVPALTHGLVLGIMIYAGAHISGGHFNPAVTLALCCVKECKWLKGLCYIAFQQIGSILAGALILMYNDQDLDIDKICLCPGIKKDYPIWRAFLLEMIATWFLMFTIMGCAVDKHKPKGVFGFAIGGMLTACIYSIGNLTGGALNPWRMIGPSIGSGDIVHEKFWVEFSIYLFAPIIGAISAAYLWMFVFKHDKDKNNDKNVDVETELVVERDFETGLVEVEVGAPAPVETENTVVAPVVPERRSQQPAISNSQQDHKWTGFFEQDGDRFEMNFNTLHVGNDGTIQGDGYDDKGTFTIEGNMTNEKVEFKKIYAQEPIFYSGSQAEFETKITGTWEIPDNCCGTWEMDLVTPKWKGWYKQDNVKEDMLLNLIIAKDGVDGQGIDTVGSFVIKGDFKDNQVTFTKQYIGQHAIEYEGEYKDLGGGEATVTGRWNYNGDGDEFELTLA